MYTLIGGGRVAKHFVHYFTQLTIPFNQWSRKQSNELATQVQDSSHVLLLIKDAAIEHFIQQNSCLKNKTLVHFSGALTIEGIYAAHPLVSFSHDLFDANFYQEIPFCLNSEGPEFAEILPRLPNPYFRIPQKAKALYHALCVLSGNFSAILWQKFFSELEQQWNVPAELGHPYIRSVMMNLLKNSQAALTGPLVRGDQITLEKNLTALGDDCFAKIYRAFIEAYHG